ncbi:MAG: hypothetical protein EOM64_00280 [Erysipelotrichia bacterium]|nr:hypothetical protein [Erysipelotrichia bacterium]
MENNRVYKKLNNRSGSVSLLELILIIGISIESVFLIFVFGRYLVRQQAKGDDALMVNTADSIARVNSNNGLNCVVNDCASQGVCTHHQDDGYTGYFDNKTNTIAGILPYGYNEYTVMEADGQEYYGAVNTMVIKVTAEEGVIQVSWVPGKADR